MVQHKKIRIVILSILLIISIIILSLIKLLITKEKKENEVIPTEKSTAITAEKPPVKPFKTDDTYGLFIMHDNRDIKVQYFKDGIISSGKYQGYERIIAIYKEDDYEAIYKTYFFATSDHINYILSKKRFGYISNYDEELKIEDFKYIEELKKTAQPEEQIFNLDKVKLLDEFPIEFPNKIKIDEKTQLSLLMAIDPKDSKKGQKLGQVSSDFPIPIYEYLILDKEIAPLLTQSTKVSHFTAGNYVIVEDSAKNQMLYKISLGEIDLKNESYYKSYAGMMPRNCGLGVRPIISNTDEGQLNEIGKTSFGFPIYEFKNKNSFLQKNQFDFKIKINKGVFEASFRDFPTEEDYLAKSPVILIRDPWNRFVATGEMDININDGCGKPVIYLYPEKPQEISIQFIRDMKFSATIPTYYNKWNVLAQPNGQLSISNNTTNNNTSICSNVDFSIIGHEYAMESCLNNTFPYLYWSGRVDGNYPDQKEGWIIEKYEIQNFLNQKLDFIGLNEKEKTDMLEYWVPQMLKTKANFFKISFIQTEEMNQFIPMRIVPRPDSVIRVFLDWTPHINRPNSNIPPQTLKHYKRFGFTIVEWGGLKY